MMENLLIFWVATPGLTFLAMAIVWLLGWTPRERIVARWTALVYVALTIAGATLGWMMFVRDTHTFEVDGGDWFHAGEYAFALSLFVDHLSWPLMMLTTLLVGLVGVFSVRYLHRDRGFYRFFLLLHLYACGALLVFSAGSFDLLLGGWELVGITSVLLIAFFDERREPVRNAIRVFAFYRIADQGMLLAIFLMHALAHTVDMKTLFPGSWPHEATHLSGNTAAWIGLLLLVTAAGKSAQAPFSGWLPRAMEGPTPSSAIFYGAISVHLGAYLMLRSESILQNAPWVAVAVGLVGGITALLATIVHRASVDAKTSLCYAGMAQLGIVFVEIALGFPRFALAHMIGHAVVRTLQFLRAPSMLHDYHRIHAAAGGHLGKTGQHYVGLLPEGVRNWLYNIAVERGYYDALLDRLVAGPVVRLATWLESIELPNRGKSKVPMPATVAAAERVAH